MTRSSTARPVRCPHCHQSRYALTNHGRTPTGKHQYRCSLCGKSFNYPLSGTQAKRIHYEPDPELDPAIYKGNFDPLSFYRQAATRMETDDP